LDGVHGEGAKRVGHQLGFWSHKSCWFGAKVQGEMGEPQVASKKDRRFHKIVTKGLK
jgi:hypothetical protein